MSFELISSILRKPWAIDPQYLEGVMPLVAGLLNNVPTPMYRVESVMPYAIIAHSSNRTNLSAAAPGSIAVVTMSGPLTKNDQFCGPVGTSRIGQWIKEADASDKIDGIILKVDSPGGSVDGTEDLARIIKGTKKPILAYIDGMAASAAYWIGSSADEVMANGKTAMIGSIGTMFMFADMQPAFEKAGVRFHEIYASKSTDKNKDFNSAIRNGNYTGMVNNFLDPLNEMFHSAVRSNRSGKLSSQENVFSGKIYFATQAKDHGLIDSIGSIEDAMRSVRSLVNSKNNPRMNTTAERQALNAPLHNASMAKFTGNVQMPTVATGAAATGNSKTTAEQQTAQQDPGRWKNKFGRYTTVHAATEQPPSAPKEEQQDETRKWRNSSGRYSTANRDIVS